MTGDHQQLIDGFRTITTSLAAADRAVDADRTARVDRTPVTVLTGFLGSGKTSVLRHLLAAEHGLRLTAIVNDLGSMNVDALSLDSAGPATGRLELSNGCACCQLDDALLDALVAASATEPPPDAIVIEASGAADAVSLAAVVEAESTVELDGIVCVIDATGWAAQLRHPTLGPLARRQVETAHIVLLSKVDLVSSDRASAVVADIATVAPGRRVVPVDHGVVDPSLVLGAAVLGAALRPPPTTDPTSLVCETIPVDRPLDRRALAAWLEAGDHGLLRVKGWILGHDGDHHELQVVGRRWTMTRAIGPRPRALVVIADDLRAVDRATAAIQGFGVQVGSRSGPSRVKVGSRTVRRLRSAQGSGSAPGWLRPASGNRAAAGPRPEDDRDAASTS